jgi:hypothetical protein
MEDKKGPKKITLSGGRRVVLRKCVGCRIMSSALQAFELALFDIDPGISVEPTALC